MFRTPTLLIISLAFMIESVDATMIATALPAIAADLHVNPVQLKAAVSAYFLVVAALIPVSGWCADRFGSRTMFCAAIGMFSFGSIVCASASILPVFILGRALQGAGGAMMLPIGRIILVTTVSREDFIRAFSYVTIPAAVGPIFAPIFAGYVTTYFSWSWLFWINLPLGVVGIALAAFFLPECRDAEEAPFDAVGWLLCAIGLCGVGFGFTAIGGAVVSTLVSALAILLGALFLAAYVRRAPSVDAPILDLRLLGCRTYRTGVVCGFFFRAGALGATPFLLPMMLQIGFGFTAFESGSVTFVGAFAALLTKFTIAPVLRYLGFRRMLVPNAILGAMSIAALALFTPNTPRLEIVAVLFVGAWFRVLQIMGLDAIGFADVPKAALSRASTLASVSKQLAASAGVAFSALILQGMQDIRGDKLPQVFDFKVAFLLVALPVGLTALMSLRLPRDAGQEISGYRRAAPPLPTR
jgi:EmrB/QacA subfamily drug resistance transporter